ncbi:MAG: hypothetical protein WCB53_20235 [Terriglobales bacterium]
MCVFIEVMSLEAIRQGLIEVPRDHPAGDSKTVEGDGKEWKSLSKGASRERLWGISGRAFRLVFLFLGGLLLGCHEVSLRLNVYLFSQGSTGHLDARATQLVV